MAMGMIALLVFLVSVVMIIVNFLRKRDNTIIFIILVISLILFCVGLSLGSKESKDNKDSSAQTEKQIMSASQWKDYQKTFKEVFDKRVKNDKDVLKLAPSHSIERNGDNIIYVNVKVAQDVKYLKDSEKQNVADRLGQMYYALALETLVSVIDKPKEMTIGVRLYYSEDDSLFAKNRMFINPKEFKVKN